MAASHKIFGCAFISIAIIGLCCHIIGFVFPGWIIIRRPVMDIRLLGFKETEITEEFRFTEGQLVDNGGVRPPMDDMKPPMDGMKPPTDDTEAPMKAPMDGMMPPKEDTGTKDKIIEFTEEDIRLHKFMTSIMAEVSFEELSIKYGLWFTKICVHGKPYMENGLAEEEEDDTEPEAENMPEPEDSSSSSEEGHHKRRHHKKCHCVSVSTRCALKKMNALFAESPESMRKHSISADNMGHGSLREHQVETTIGLILMVIGIVGGFVMFRKPDGCRCVKLVTIIVLLVAVVLVSIPVMRMVHYSHYRRSLHDGVQVGCPPSAFFSGGGCIAILISCLIAVCALISQRRKAAGQWYRFNNELVNEETKKGPALVFHNDPYPVKVGLADVCDFSDIKPVEAFTEPEKVPLE